MGGSHRKESLRAPDRSHMLRNFPFSPEPGQNLPKSLNTWLRKFQIRYHFCITLYQVTFIFVSDVPDIK